MVPVLRILACDHWKIRKYQISQFSSPLNAELVQKFTVRLRLSSRARMSFLSALLIAFFVILSSSARTDSCGTSGVQYCIDNNQGDYGWTDGSDSYIGHGIGVHFYFLGLRGSFIAKTTGSHTFSYAHGLNFGSFNDFKVDITIETTTTRVDKDSSLDPLSMIVDFRYRYQVYMTEERYAVWIELQITFPSGRKSQINSDSGETCYESGCRNTGLSRVPYACKPSPSRSKSPSPTRTVSKSPSPTASISHSPTESHTPVVTWTMAATPTATDTPTQSASETSLFTFSGSYNVSDEIRFSDEIPPTDSLNASFVLDDSDFLTDSVPFAESDGLSPSQMSASELAESFRPPDSEPPAFSEAFMGSKAAVMTDAFLAVSDEFSASQRATFSEAFGSSASFARTATRQPTTQKAVGAGGGTIAIAAGAGAGVILIVAVVLGLVVCRKSEGVESDSPDVEFMGEPADVTIAVGSWDNAEAITMASPFTIGVLDVVE
jgi:hypothetical protein